MIRPNLAMDAPPVCIYVGGAPYKVDHDYRTWIKILELTRQLYSSAYSVSDAVHNLSVIYKMERLAFGGVLVNEKPREALISMMTFLKGYPDIPDTGESRGKDPTFSFEYDINYIILAIRNQGGPDLSYRRSEAFHWWEFLLEFKSLCGEHYILRLMQIRGFEDCRDASCDTARREALRLKRRFALPYEMTADEKRAADEFDRLTGG